MDVRLAPRWREALGVKVAWLADALEIAGRRGADPGRVPRGGARRGRRSSSAAPDAAGARSPAATSPACTTRSPIRPRRSRRCAGKPALRYWHDLARPGTPADTPLLRWALEHATNVFTSPLHRDRFPHPVDGDASSSRRRSPLRASPRAPRASARAARAGSAPASTRGKGLLQACEWAEANEPVDFWGHVDAARDRRACASRARSRPTTSPTILRLYERFVFLPTHTEPFGRAVVEAWAAGCELIVNRNVGALHWLEQPGGARDRGRATSGGWSEALA